MLIFKFYKNTLKLFLHAEFIFVMKTVQKLMVFDKNSNDLLRAK